MRTCRGALLALAVVACGGRSDGVTPAPTATSSPSTSPRAFRHHRSKLVIGMGAANHRGRDALVLVSEPQTIEAKFAYGSTDKDLEDEDVLIERELPGGDREHIAVVRTSIDTPSNDGGRARYTIPVDHALPPGRHSFRFTVVGDGTQTELSLVVAPPGTPIFVSDVDGTLTASEVAEFPALASGVLPAAHPDAAAVFRKLSDQGLVPIYLTARPEWLTARTRAFLRANAFPPGIVLTRRNKMGAFGTTAAAFKLGELENLAKRFRIEWAFGNMPSDADAYAPIVSNPKHRVLYRQDDPRHGARRIDAYTELLRETASP